MRKFVTALAIFLNFVVSTSLLAADMKECHKFQERQGKIYLPNMDEGYTGDFHCIRDYNSVGKYTNGLKTGEWTEYSGGTKHLQGSYANGKKIGVWQKFKYGGDVIGEFEYLNDKLHGLYTSYYANGQRKEQGKYAHGAKDGLFKQWHANGQKASEVMYENDERTGKFQSWHENGSTKELAQFDGGKQTGKYTYQDNQGNTIEESNYVDGKLHGLSIEKEVFKPDGKLYLVSEINYKHGEKHGESSGYRTGELYSKLRKKHVVVHKQTSFSNYINGRKHGRQVSVSNCCIPIDRGYYSTASISNYKNGRQHYELRLENDRRKNKKLKIELINWGGSIGKKIKELRVPYKDDKYETTLYEDDKSVRMSFAAAMWKELVEKKYLNKNSDKTKQNTIKPKETASQKTKSTNMDGDDVKKKLIKSLFGF